MNDKKKLYIGLTIIITITIVGLCIYAIMNNEKAEVKVENDTQTFIDIYEGLNGKEDEYRETNYLSINIDKNAEIFIKSDEEIVDIIENESALIYFGFEDCPWCRNMIGTLTKVAAEEDYPLYYVDIKEIRNSYSVVDGEVVETKEGSAAYYEILALLDEHLSEYIISDEEDKEYDTETKRVYAPNVVGINNGEVVDFLAPGEEYLGDPYEDLTEEQEKNLSDRYNEMLDKITEEVCDLDKSEGC